MRTENSIKLSEQEQGRLIRAIESAIEVTRQDQFQAWMCGPFRELLPHQNAVCLELGRRGDVLRIDCLQHNVRDATAMDFLCHPQYGLAVLLVRSFHGRAQLSCTFDANSLQQILQGRVHDAVELHNAIVHRTKFLSGASYFFVLVNVPKEQFDRNPPLFKLLSSHLKMALSRSVSAQEHSDNASITPRELEILRAMEKGKSNKQISAILNISPITLKSHISKIYRKLNVQNRADAVVQGLKHQRAPVHTEEQL